MGRLQKVSSLKIGLAPPGVIIYNLVATWNWDKSRLGLEVGNKKNRVTITVTIRVRVRVHFKARVGY